MKTPTIHLIIYLLICLTNPLISAEKTENKSTTYNYLQYLPKDFNKDKTTKCSLLIFLHGMGERGNNLSLLEKHGPPRLIAAGKELPYIVIAPQCPDTEWWNTQKLNKLLDEILKENRIDKKRIYLTGISMGGFATWDWATQHPDRFAAIIPICGGADPTKANRLTHLPIWSFHGEQDKTVPITKEQPMIDALKKLHANIKFTTYPDAAHDSWTRTYNNPEIFDWLSAQHK